jgi:putative serine protease PepD
MDSNIYPQETQNDPQTDSVSQATGNGPSPEPNFIRLPYTSSQPDSQPKPEKPTKKRGGLTGLLLVAMLMMSTLFGGAGAGVVMLMAGSNSTITATAATTTTSATASTGSAQLIVQADEATINGIYQKLSPSVVMITSQVPTGRRSGGTSEAVGTGMVIDKQGDILTNYHVIQGATSVKVKLADGSEYDATVVGTAPQNDLALLKADIPAASLVPVVMGDSSTVKVGDAVITIGYPYALDQSVSSGIVSGLDRAETSTTNGTSLSGLIQVDAAINPGNSGGPLVNAAGQVVGINTMIESPVDGFTGIGMAIPINQVKSLLSQLEAGGSM